MIRNRRDRISPLYPGYYPFFDDFNEIFAAFLKSVANRYYSLKSGHSGYVRTIFQRVILRPLQGRLDVFGEHIGVIKSLKGFNACYGPWKSFFLGKQTASNEPNLPNGPHAQPAELARPASTLLKARLRPAPARPRSPGHAPPRPHACACSHAGPHQCDSGSSAIDRTSVPISCPISSSPSDK